jgi:hypothetical protein
VASTEHHEPAEEKFAQNGGTFIAVLGGVVVAGFLIGWALDADGVPLWVPAGAMLGAVLIWTSIVRPRVLVEMGQLVLRNMFSTVRIPLATVEEIAVQQVLAVRAADKRYVCAGVGRSLRQVMKGTSFARARQQAGALTGEVAADIESGMDYGDYVETRLRHLVRMDRDRRGIRAFSPEMEELGKQVTREPAWPEITALGVALVLLVVAILVS